MAEEDVQRQQEEIKKLMEDLGRERIRYKVLAKLQDQAEQDVLEESQINRENKAMIEQLEEKSKTLEERNEELQKDIEEVRSRNRDLIKQKEDVERKVKKEAKKNSENLSKYDRLQEQQEQLNKKNNQIIQQLQEERMDGYSKYCLTKEKERRNEKRKEKSNTE